MKGCYDVQMDTDLSAKQILDFYISAGVDETIGDEPINWFNRPVPTATPASQSTVKARRPLPARAPLADTSAATSVPSTNVKAVIENAQKAALAATDLQMLQSTISNFEGCALKQLATNCVFSSGDVNSDLMIIDRPPSADEDRSGAPFSGASREMLEKMLKAIGLDLAQQYLASSLPWRPPGGRAPTFEETEICRPFLARHIELKSPKIVILFGEAAAFALNRKEGINKLRGKWVTFDLGDKSIKALPMFHPNFLIEHPAAKRHAWSDLLKLRAAISELS